MTRVETIQGATTTWEYGYDAAGRLETVTKDGLLASQYAYDANGNRLVKQTPTVYETGTYDAQDRMLSYAGASYTYTANGETLTKTDTTGTTSYQYDVFGSLLGVDLPNGTQIRYRVDGRNRRVERSVNGVVTQRWLWQGQLSPIAELDSSNAVVSRFVYATRVNVPDSMIRGGVTYRIPHDHLGSPRLVVNTSTGAIAQRMDFDEWGIVTADTNPGWQPFGFGGGVVDTGSQLVRFGARDFSGMTGTWQSKDALRFRGGDEALYGFPRRDPVNNIDPAGLADICYRPLKYTWFVAGTRSDEILNQVVGHQHIWFDNGENVGFGPDGRFSEPPEKRRKYRRCQTRYDDDLLRLAIENISANEDGKYDFFTNNCQEWVDRVLAEYKRLEGGALP